MNEEQRIRELRNQIDYLQAVDRSSLSEDDVNLHLERILYDGVHRLLHIGQECLFRARKHTDQPLLKNVSELVENSAGRTTRGRFNEAGRPRFYCSFGPQTAIWETRPELGALITVLVMARRSDRSYLQLTGAGLHLLEGEIIEGMPILRQYDEFTSGLKALGVFDRWLVQDDFLAKLATEFFPEETAGDGYKLSAALASNWERDPEAQGVIFPSVASDRYGINCAVLPEAMHDAYFPVEAWQLRVAEDPILTSPMEDKRLRFSFERVSYSISPDGSIKWQDVNHLPFKLLADAADRVEYWRNELKAGNACDFRLSRARPE